MKKIFVFILTFFIYFNAFSEIRTFYFARHGQRGLSSYIVKLKNCNDDRLMPKGVEQAKALGKYMKILNFSGEIYVSPYYRTLETAILAANEWTDQKLILEPRIQEVTGLKDSSGNRRISKKCITKSEIKKYFPNVIIPKKMKFPWRFENEKQSLADERVNDFIEDVLKNSKNDVFVVCHGGIINSVVREMNKRNANFQRRLNPNCCLYSFSIDTEAKKVVSSSDETRNFLPPELLTDNLNDKIF